MTSSKIRPLLYAVPAILLFLALAATVIVVRLSTPETANNRLSSLTFGPTLNEAMGRGWQEVSWQKPTPPDAEAARLRQGVLFLDVLAAVRAQQRALAIDLLHLLDEALGGAEDRSAAEKVRAELASVRSDLEERKSFDVVGETLLQIEPDLRAAGSFEVFRLGLFLEQGRLTFEHGKMPPLSWERELAGYLESASTNGTVRTYLEQLQSVPTRSGKMDVLRSLLQQLGDGELLPPESTT